MVDRNLVVAQNYSSSLAIEFFVVVVVMVVVTVVLVCLLCFGFVLISIQCLYSYAFTECGWLSLFSLYSYLNFFISIIFVISSCSFTVPFHSRSITSGNLLNPVLFYFFLETFLMNTSYSDRPISLIAILLGVCCTVILGIPFAFLMGLIPCFLDLPLI